MEGGSRIITNVMHSPFLNQFPNGQRKLRSALWLASKKCHSSEGASNMEHAMMIASFSRWRNLDFYIMETMAIHRTVNTYYASPGGHDR